MSNTKSTPRGDIVSRYWRGALGRQLVRAGFAVLGKPASINTYGPGETPEKVLRARLDSLVREWMQRGSAGPSVSYRDARWDAAKELRAVLNGEDVRQDVHPKSDEAWMDGLEADYRAILADTDADETRQRRQAVELVKKVQQALEYWPVGTPLHSRAADLKARIARDVFKVNP